MPQNIHEVFNIHLHFAAALLFTRLTADGGLRPRALVSLLKMPFL